MAIHKKTRAWPYWLLIAFVCVGVVAYLSGFRP